MIYLLDIAVVGVKGVYAQRGQHSSGGMATIFFALRLISALIRFKWSQCRLCTSDLSCLLASFDSCRKLIFLSSYPKCANLRIALNWLWTCCPASEIGCVMLVRIISDSGQYISRVLYLGKFIRQHLQRLAIFPVVGHQHFSVCRILCLLPMMSPHETLQARSLGRCPLRSNEIAQSPSNDLIAPESRLSHICIY